MEADMWIIVKDLNRAKFNKEALDEAIEEEEALLDCLNIMDERIHEAYRNCAAAQSTNTVSPSASSSIWFRKSKSPHRSERQAASPTNLVVDQIGVYRIIDGITANMQTEIDKIKKKHRDDSAETREGGRIALSLQLEAAERLGKDQVASSSSPPETLGELDSLVEEKRRLCKKWLDEHQELRNRTLELEQENELLEQQCHALEQEAAANEEKVALLTDINRLEAAIETLVKLLSIAPAVL